jgi:hypothetical protein
MTLPQRVDIAREHGPFRLFSVDGGHTFDHVVKDLAFAQDTLAQGGVIMAEDYMHSHWPAVTEGVHHFITGGARVKPFLHTGNKLFLCLASAHGDYFRPFKERYGQMHRHKVARMWGWDTLVVTNRSGASDIPRAGASRRRHFQGTGLPVTMPKASPIPPRRYLG